MDEEEKHSEESPGRGRHPQKGVDGISLGEVLGEHEYYRDRAQQVEIGGERLSRGRGSAHGSSGSSDAEQYSLDYYPHGGVVPVRVACD